MRPLVKCIYGGGGDRCQGTRATRASIAGCDVLAFLEPRQEYGVRTRLPSLAILRKEVAGWGRVAFIYCFVTIALGKREGVFCALCGAAKSS